MDINFDKAVERVLSFGLSPGDLPFVLSVDDSIIQPALGPYQDAGQWKLAGMHAQVVSFDSMEAMLEIANVERHNLAEKVRIDSTKWFLSILTYTFAGRLDCGSYRFH